MVKCCAPKCSNASYKKKPDITFHRFPKDESVRDVLIKNINRKNWQPNSTIVLCSKHFDAHLICKSDHRTVLIPGPIPTFFDKAELQEEGLKLIPMSKVLDVACDFHDHQKFKGEKLIYPAATRNQEPILQVLKRFIICDAEEIDNDSPLFLEVASGSGQHLAHFAPHFKGVNFQPSEFDEDLHGSINYYALNCATKNILLPLLLDIRIKLSNYGFEDNSIDYMYCSNLIHISPFECTIGLFENAGTYLKPDALLITYGPYGKDGVITPESNIQFDASLKSRDPSWGIRDITELVKLGEKNNLCLIDTVDMPANNKTLIWKKN